VAWAHLDTGTTRPSVTLSEAKGLGWFRHVFPKKDGDSSLRSEWQRLIEWWQCQDAHPWHTACSI